LAQSQPSGAVVLIGRMCAHHAAQKIHSCRSFISSNFGEEKVRMKKNEGTKNMTEILLLKHTTRKHVLYYI